MGTTTARVIEVHRTNLIIQNETGEYTATVRGSFHEAGDFPKVGDYVSFEIVGEDQAVITEVLPRKTVIARRVADTDEEQIIVTNVDLVCIVMGLDGDFNINRLERYLHLVSQSGAQGLVILNKKDLTSELDSQRALAEAAAGAMPVVVVAALQGEGLSEIQEHIVPETTAVLLGSSGSGKSTITNWLLGEKRQEVQETRADDNRGRHTTTSRQLFSLPNGGFIIDTPGMRELGMLDEDLSGAEYYDRIKEIAAQCRYRNCDHKKSDGCAVLQAVQDGVVTQREVEQFYKLEEERMLQGAHIDNKTRFKQQAEKRTAQKNMALLRKRLSGR